MRIKLRPLGLAACRGKLDETMGSQWASGEAHWGKAWLGNSALRGPGSGSGPENIFLQRPRRAIGRFWAEESWSDQLCTVQIAGVCGERTKRAATKDRK